MQLMRESTLGFAHKIQMRLLVGKSAVHRLAIRATLVLLPARSEQSSALHLGVFVHTTQGSDCNLERERRSDLLRISSSRRLAVEKPFVSTTEQPGTVQNVR